MSGSASPAARATSVRVGAGLHGHRGAVEIREVPAAARQRTFYISLFEKRIQHRGHGQPAFALRFTDVHDVVPVGANDIDDGSCITPAENPLDDHCFSYRVGSPASAREPTRKRVSGRNCLRRQNERFAARVVAPDLRPHHDAFACSELAARTPAARCGARGLLSPGGLNTSRRAVARCGPTPAPDRARCMACWCCVNATTFGNDR